MEEQTGEKRLRLIVFSEQALLRTSLAMFLSSEPGLEVVRECASCGEALDTLKTSSIDVVLLDVAVACADAKDFVSAARSAGYQGRVLILAENAEAERLTMALKLGASGIFRKSEAPDRLVLAIRLVAAGAVWVDQSVIALLTVQPSDQSNQVANRRSGALLEEREEKIIQGIMDGLTTKKLGDDMNISEGSVKNILQGLFAKTGVRKRSQLVRLALEGALGARLAKRQAAGPLETVPTHGESSD
jgi:two-component system, NarL family, nitrate/nitrite response regulator NarL